MKYIYTLLLILGIAMGNTACSSDDTPEPEKISIIESEKTVKLDRNGGWVEVKISTEKSWKLEIKDVSPNGASDQEIEYVVENYDGTHNTEGIGDAEVWVKLHENPRKANRMVEMKVTAEGEEDKILVTQEWLQLEIKHKDKSIYEGNVEATITSNTSWKIVKVDALVGDETVTYADWYRIEGKTEGENGDKLNVWFGSNFKNIEERSVRLHVKAAGSDELLFLTVKQMGDNMEGTVEQWGSRMFGENMTKEDEFTAKSFDKEGNFIEDLEVLEFVGSTYCVVKKRKANINSFYLDKLRILLADKNKTLIAAPAIEFDMDINTPYWSTFKDEVFMKPTRISTTSATEPEVVDKNTFWVEKVSEFEYTFNFKDFVYMYKPKNKHTYNRLVFNGKSRFTIIYQNDNPIRLE